MDKITPEVVGKLLTDFARIRFIRTQEVLNEFRLYPGQPYVLFTLMEHGSMTQTQLARTIGRRPATITVMLSRMEEAGLIARDTSQEDRRCAFVRLTEQGRSIGSELRDRYIAIDRECFDGFSAEDLNTISGFVVRMNDNMVKKLSGRDVASMLAFGRGNVAGGELPLPGNMKTNENLETDKENVVATEKA